MLTNKFIEFLSTLSCDAEARCKNCSPGKGCKAQLPHQVWYAKEHGSVKGEDDMMAALQDGPIVCGMAVTEDFENYKGFDIFVDKSGDVQQDHAISIVGYGEDNGVKYWLGRNSWGTWYVDSIFGGKFTVNHVIIFQFG